MKVDTLISQLEERGLEIHIQRNKKQTSLYYLCNKSGNKFLEIHYNKADEVTLVKFHEETLIPSGVSNSVKLSGDDDKSITKKIDFANNANDIVAVSIASYNKVKSNYEFRQTKKKNKF